MTSFSDISTLTNLTPDEKRNLLFNINNTLEIPIEDFDNNWWPLVTNVWTQWNFFKLINGDSWKTYTCRLTKHRESSKRQQENVPVNKRRKTSIRPSGICQAKVKISHLISLNIVRIERYKDSPDHTHNLKENDQVKRNQAVRVLVEKEANKNYSPQAITSAIKEYASNELNLGASVSYLKTQEVANIKYKIRGPMETHLIGNQDLKTDIIETVSYLMNQEYQVQVYTIPK